MGRPGAGQRKQVNVRLPVDLIERIDAARGMTSRDAWFARAAELALKPTAVVKEPNLGAPVHRHHYRLLVATKMTNGKKYRTHRCDCGLEQDIEVA